MSVLNMSTIDGKWKILIEFSRAVHVNSVAMHLQLDRKTCMQDITAIRECNSAKCQMLSDPMQNHR